MCNPTDGWPAIHASSGRVVDMSSDGQGNVALLLDHAPWLAVVDSHGVLTEIPVRSGLAWAGRVWAAPNGTVVALSSSATSGVQFQRFDADGSLIGSGEWADAKSTLVASAVRADGRLALLASSGELHTLLTLSTDDELLVTGTLGSTAAREVGCCNSKPQDFVVSATGEYLLTGYTRPNTGVWWASVGSTLANHVLEGGNLGYSTPQVVAKNGNQFTAFTASFVNGGTGPTSVIRLGAKLDEMWHWTSLDTDSLVEDLVALPDGVLVAGRSKLTPTLTRFDRDGNNLTLPISTTDSMRLVAATDYDILLLEQPANPRSNSGFRLSQWRLSAWNDAAQPSAGICEADADCASLHCCFQGASRVGRCGEQAGCGLDEQCSRDADCASGTCLLGVAVCALPCSQSQTCPENRYCAEACSVMPCASVCLPDCLGKSAGYCEAFGSWKCQKTDNTEGIQVSVCQP